MQHPDFSHVETWIFDLDNTLYPPRINLFAQIEQRMTDYVARTLDIAQETANTLRAHYWQRYGTTLAGLIAEHDIAPLPFLEDVHDIDFTPLHPDPELRALIGELPGRKIVYTNADTRYAARVLEARGLAGGLFDATYGIETADFLPKPARAAFNRIIALDGHEPARAAMFEDEARNLAVPHDLGMRTVHVHPSPGSEPHIHHGTEDLTAFLTQIVAPGSTDDGTELPSGHG